MLTLTQALRHEILAHTLAAKPDEACGILAGPPGSHTPTRYIPMRNAAHEPARPYLYQFDPAQQLAAYQDMDQRGEDPLAIVHSHTATEARPSAVDILHAADPQTLYLIVSLKDPAAPVLRAWRIHHGAATEEAITVPPAQPNTMNQPATALDA